MAEPSDARGAVEGGRDRARRGDQDLRRGARPDLPGQDRQDPVPGAARGDRARRTRTDASWARLRGQLRCGWARRRGAQPALARLAARRWPVTSSAGGSLRRLRPASRALPAAPRIRSVHQVASAAPRLGLDLVHARWPSSFASSSSRSDERYPLASAGRVERRLEARDDLPREVELRLAHLDRLDRLVDLRLAIHVLGDEQRLQRERVALRRGSGTASPCRRARTSRAPAIPVSRIAASSSAYGRRCASVPAGTR